MTDEELKARVAIGQRLAACTQAGDARKADAYAACFAIDGVLQLDQAIAGREAIRQWMRAPSVIPAADATSPGFVSHHLTTCSVELTGAESAKARTYWLVTTTAGLDHNGYYDDRLRKVGDDWLIEHRRPRTLWTAPGSLVRG